MKDFPDEEAALQVADHLISKNQPEFEHEGQSQLDTVFPLLNKYRYIESHGKLNTWEQVEVKRLAAVASVKSASSIREAGVLMEAMGPAASAIGEAKEVSPAWDQAHTAAIDLRIRILF